MLSLLLACGLAAATPALPAPSPDPDGDHQLLPRLAEGPAELRRDWTRSAEGWVSPPREWDTAHPRLGALLWVEDEAAAPMIEVRTLDADGQPGPWLEVPETSRGEGWRVLVRDLPLPAARAQVRVSDPEGIESLAWELRTPVREARRPAGAAPPPPPSLPGVLLDIGVIPRDSWGARATTCTTTEDDWYRFAIHHTAGSQTYGGTVQGAVQALQAYSMDSGEYCDIPYQFLVGYDGSLWEGRPYGYYSGATGGGNNDGNFAVSYLGCYTGSGCPGSSHEDTDIMMAWGRVLVQTLAIEHGIITNDDTLRGHRDWPGNSTVCPGDYIYERLGELQSSVSYYQGQVTAVSWTDTLHVPEGEEVEVQVDVLNTGMWSWEPGWTFLAPTPRDVGSALQGSDWSSSTRAATVDSTVPPGSTASFRFLVPAVATSQSFGLVTEWVTWFADLPYGGGPGDAALSLSVTVDPASDGGSADGGSPDGGSADGGSADGGGLQDGGSPGDGGGVDTGLQGDSGAHPPGLPPGTAVAMADGGGCTSAPVSPGLLGAGAWLLGLLARRRRDGRRT